MATVKELTAIIDQLAARVAALETSDRFITMMMDVARADGYREGRESVLGSESQPKVPKPRHLSSV